METGADLTTRAGRGPAAALAPYLGIAALAALAALALVHLPDQLPGAPGSLAGDVMRQLLGLAVFVAILYHARTADRAVARPLAIAGFAPVLFLSLVLAARAILLALMARQDWASGPASAGVAALAALFPALRAQGIQLAAICCATAVFLCCVERRHRGAS